MNLFVGTKNTFYNKLQVSYFDKISDTALILYLSNGDRFKINTKTPQELENFINELGNLE
ncbi:hypothetical protein [[Clostridium] colinum]|uniref:hypothetical protein n=1 Tax=[Clostridium] colinum TaxID=36835 RepID=UPI002024A529|nr:hypothetical protein [[Clostridium] colinum]